eukprot:403352585
MNSRSNPYNLKENLDLIDEEQIEESSNSLQHFANEAARVTKSLPLTIKNHQPLDNSIDLRSFPNADFYYKLVAKVNGKYYSIYHGQTEYVIGVQMTEPVQPDRKGGFYVYGSLKEAVFADVPFNKGGHYIAPRTVLKLICWGDFIKYEKGKIAFTNILPVEDVGLPIGYKNSKESIKMALKQQEERKYRMKEGSWNKALVQKNARQGYEKDKFENYFGKNEVQRVLGEDSNKGNSRPQSSKYQYVNQKSQKIIDEKITREIQGGLNQMIMDLEKQYR